MKDINSDTPFGPDFLAHVSVLEGRCELKSLQLMEEDELSPVVDRLAVCLSLLYQEACCAWGCHGREHVIEYAAGRTVTHAMAAYRLALRGLYDESLSLTRNIAEIANLIALFWQDTNAIREWLDASEKDRRIKFSPVKVRIRLHSAEHLIPVDQEQYAQLCELAVHFSPNTLPGAHNDPGVPVLGGLIQEQGLRFTICQLAWMVATVAGPIGQLAMIPEEKAKELVEASTRLLESIPEEGQD